MISYGRLATLQPTSVRPTFRPYKKLIDGQLFYDQPLRKCDELYLSANRCINTTNCCTRTTSNRASLPSFLPSSLPPCSLVGGHPPTLALSFRCYSERWKVAWLWFALLFSFFVYASMAGWWTGASTPRLEVAEAALLKQYGQVRRKRDLDHLADHTDQGCTFPKIRTGIKHDLDLAGHIDQGRDLSIQKISSSWNRVWGWRRPRCSISTVRFVEQLANLI